MRYADWNGRSMEGARGRRRLGFDRVVSLTMVLVVTAIFALGAQTMFNLETQVKGVLPTVNGGTGQNSTATFPASGTVMTTATGVVCGQLPTITGGSVTSAGGTCVLNVANTAVSAGSYTYSSITVGADGRLTAASSGTAPVTINFADNETPTGSCNGSNQTFTSAHTPNPAASLNFFLNGQLLIAGGADYSLSTATVTTVGTCASGDVVRESYRW